MNMKIITLIALALGCLAIVGISSASDDSNAAVVDPGTGTQVGDLYYTFSGTDATVVGISSDLSSATSITIPDTVENGGTTYTVTAIAEGRNSDGHYGVFMELTDLTTVNLPSGLETIGMNAFYGCSSLNITELPDGVTTINQAAFLGCTSLTTMDLGESLVTLGFGPFYNCTNLASVTFPDTLTTMGDSCFLGTALTTADLASTGLTAIGKSAFTRCPNLASVTFPDTLTTMGTACFRGTALTTADLASTGLTAIEENAFAECTSLEAVYIPIATVSIDSMAFYQSTNVEFYIAVSVTAGGDTDIVSWHSSKYGGSQVMPDYRVIAPSTYNNMFLADWTYNGTDYNGGVYVQMSLDDRSITANIDPSTYGTCGAGLNWILYTDYNLSITGTGAMYDYTVESPAPWDSYKASIVSLSLPAGMTSIGDNAFSGCSAITGTIAIPSAVTSIGSNAFYDCTGFEGILVIPSAVTAVEGGAFYNCGYSGMIIEGSPTFSESDTTFGSSDGESFKEVLNLGNTEISAGSYGLPTDAEVRSDIPLMGYIAPTSISETEQKEGTVYDLMAVIPILIIASILLTVAYTIITRRD